MRHREIFRGGTRGNGVSIVKVFKNALWPALRTIFRQKCTGLQDLAYIQSQNFSGGPEEVTPLLAPRQQFPVGSPAFPLFQIYETTTDAKSDESETGFGLSNGIRPWLQIGSGPHSIGHGGTCPSLLQMAGGHRE